jgi:hypothetical protein
VEAGGAGGDQGTGPRGPDRLQIVAHDVARCLQVAVDGHRVAAAPLLRPQQRVVHPGPLQDLGEGLGDAVTAGEERADAADEVDHLRLRLAQAGGRGGEVLGPEETAFGRLGGDVVAFGDTLVQGHQWLGQEPQVGHFAAGQFQHPVHRDAAGAGEGTGAAEEAAEELGRRPVGGPFQQPLPDRAQQGDAGAGGIGLVQRHPVGRADGETLATADTVQVVLFGDAVGCRHWGFLRMGAGWGGAGGECRPPRPESVGIYAPNLVSRPAQAIASGIRSTWRMCPRPPRIQARSPNCVTSSGQM